MNLRTSSLLVSLGVIAVSTSFAYTSITANVNSSIQRELDSTYGPLTSCYHQVSEYYGQNGSCPANERFKLHTNNRDVQSISNQQCTCAVKFSDNTGTPAILKAKVITMMATPVGAQSILNFNLYVFQSDINPNIYNVNSLRETEEIALFANTEFHEVLFSKHPYSQPDTLGGE